MLPYSTSRYGIEGSDGALRIHIRSIDPQRILYFIQEINSMQGGDGQAGSEPHPPIHPSGKLLCNPPNRPWETSKTKGGERWVVKQIPEWNRFTSNSTRIYALQPHLIMTSFVDPTSKDPQFWDFRNHPFAPPAPSLRSLEGYERLVSIIGESRLHF